MWRQEASELFSADTKAAERYPKGARSHNGITRLRSKPNHIGSRQRYEYGCTRERTSRGILMLVWLLLVEEFLLQDCGSFAY